MDLDKAKVHIVDSKPVGCTCKYPNEKFRNGSGHSKDCPIHQLYLKSKGKCGTDNCGCG